MSSLRCDIFLEKICLCFSTDWKSEGVMDGDSNDIMYMLPNGVINDNNITRYWSLKGL